MTPQVQTFSLGSFRCHALEAGSFHLDGGAMFGVVPKPLWSRRVEPDEGNRIPLAFRCLLIEHPNGLVLIDTGLGNKEDAKFHETYGAENEGDDGRTMLEDAIEAAGHSTDAVRFVINTHLHFDAAGGNTWEEKDEAGVALGGPQLTFPNATYVVQLSELEFARHPNERTRVSYLPANFEPVAEAGKWKLLRGDVEILPGISSWVTPGHVPNHQCVVVKNGGDSLIFLSDVMPTRHHLPLPWIMGYDLEPLRTLESKRRVIRAASDGWWLFFAHDPDVVMGRLGEGDAGPALGDVVRVANPGFEGV